MVSLAGLHHTSRVVFALHCMAWRSWIGFFPTCDRSLRIQLGLQRLVSLGHWRTWLERCGSCTLSTSPRGSRCVPSVCQEDCVQAIDEWTMSCRWLELVQFGHSGRSSQLQGAIFSTAGEWRLLVADCEFVRPCWSPDHRLLLGSFAAEVGRERDKHTVLSFVEDEVGLSRS